MLDTQYNESLYYVKYIKSYRRIITQKISKQQLNRHTSTIVLLLIYCQKHQQKSTLTFPCNPALICYSQRFALGVISTFWQWKHYIQQEAMKNNTQTKTIEELAYRYKKIKDYVYDMQSVLGKGNFSTVYRGRNQDKNEEIAVKVVKMTSLTFKKLQQLLQQEIITTRMLNHPNTIRCYEVLKSVNHCYFITELCQGGTLEKLLKRKGTLNQEDAWPYIRDIYQGLKYLNSKNIIHRDIKAANIFIKSGVAKIADFGFAIQTKQHFKDINIGSPLYMSPEGLCDNIYGPKTDVWAFGLVIYELLHGKAPLAHAATQQQLQNLLKVQLRVDQLRPDLSPDMKQLILRCLEVDQQKRIAMGQIQKLPYIQNNYFPKVMTCISLNNTRYRRLSGPNSNMLLVPQQNFYKTSVRTITNLENKQNKENFRPKNERQCQKSCSVKLIATARRIQKVPSDEIESNTSITLDYRQRDMIIANITFNQAIGMIHYCRIGFKLAQENISCQLKKWIKSLVLMILQEIKIKLNSDQIQYVDDHNRERKESKLKLVVNEYLSKYCKEMQGEKAQVVLPHLQDSLKKKLAQLQKRGDENINLLYLTMLFTIFTQALAKATQCKNYKFFGQTGVVDTSLQVKNIPLCYESYESSRKIYQHHFQNVFCTVKQ